MGMTPEERAVIKAALKWHRTITGQRSAFVSHAAQGHLLDATHALWLSRQPLHTVEPILCMVYANNSATMFCVLPVGHVEHDEPRQRYVGDITVHAGYPNNDPKNGRRLFRHSPYYETMETHERPACPRFPGCERHP